jgi:hypothetical protein
MCYVRDLEEIVVSPVQTELAASSSKTRFSTTLFWLSSLRILLIRLTYMNVCRSNLDFDLVTSRLDARKK